MARAAVARAARRAAAGDDPAPAPALRRALASLHGLKYCFTCGACKSRDINAAHNILQAFLQEWNFGARPPHLIPNNQLVGAAAAARVAETADVEGRPRHRIA